MPQVLQKKKGENHVKTRSISKTPVAFGFGVPSTCWNGLVFPCLTRVCGGEESGFGLIATFVLATLLCISVWMFICAVERLNDMNRPRWYVLFLLIPYVNLAVWLWLFFSKSRQKMCEEQIGNPTASGVS